MTARATARPRHSTSFAESDPRVRVLHLSRNYGQTAALMAAIQNSTGDVIIPMDGDGQNDPADIPRLLAKLAEGFDVVSGWRTARQDDALTRRLPSVVANRLISALLRVPLHDYGCTLKAYRREVVEDVRLYGEMHRFIPIYAAWEGARVTELAVAHHPRRFGRSKYGIGRVARVLLDLLILYFIDRAFDRPIQFFGKLGLGFLVLAVGDLRLGGGAQIRLRRHLIQTPLPLLAATIGLSGVLFLLLGIIAEVQARIYFEARGRPPYKIRRVVQHRALPRRRAAPAGGSPMCGIAGFTRPGSRRRGGARRDEPRTRPSRTGRQRRLRRSQGSHSATRGWRSSISRAAPSRGSTRRAATRSSSTARSTATGRSPTSCAAAESSLRDRSDTEVLFQLIRRLGVRRAVERIDGMFAFAFRDGADGALYLVRDRFGEKPLYWGMAGDRLVFASEVSALFCHPAFADTAPDRLRRLQPLAVRVSAGKRLGMDRDREARTRHDPDPEGRPDQPRALLAAARRHPRG